MKLWCYLSRKRSPLRSFSVFATINAIIGQASVYYLKLAEAIASYSDPQCVDVTLPRSNMSGVCSVVIWGKSKGDAYRMVMIIYCHVHRY